jgi:hypothetical protein
MLSGLFGNKKDAKPECPLVPNEVAEGREIAVFGEG